MSIGILIYAGVDLFAKRIGPDGATGDVRWVDGGAVVTSGGLSSGAGRELAVRTAQIEYDWDPGAGR